MSKIFAIILTILIALFIISAVVLNIPNGTGLQTKAIVLSLLFAIISIWGIVSIIKSL